MSREALSLALCDREELTGFRLQRLEIFNWGTFDERVWTLQLDGRSALLTGDIGSGKSTLVDAITTLLVPRAEYNKAAGAQRNERDLRSYVLGHYKSERQGTIGQARAVSLRRKGQYSVLLGVFGNAGTGKTVTLAQVLWMRDEADRTPERLCVGCEQDLSIREHFSNFGAQIGDLRKRLKGQGAQVFDSFKAYAAWFRRKCGIQGEQAMDLFHQTVSLKAIGNLTDFVRGHMLESFDVRTRLVDLMEHYENLNAAHEAVLKAKRQIAMLGPLVADCRRHDELDRQVGHLRECRNALHPWISERKGVLLERRLATHDEDLARSEATIRQLEADLVELDRQDQGLRKARHDNGGERLEQLAREIRQKTEEFDRRKGRSGRYAALVKELGERPAATVSGFVRQQGEFRELRNRIEDERAELQNRASELRVAGGKAGQELAALQAEIAGLKKRGSNIAESQVSLRRALCRELGIPEADMPFVGELLKVREEERPWEGAIERLLHGFGLSLLVAEEHYARVADWVDRTHLGGRLVYYRVREHARGEGASELHPASLVRKIQIRPDSGFYAWLERELAQRFNYACCRTQEEFRRESRAVTQAGQIKVPGGRHEKDDRHRIDDRRQYVLGWSNAEKIAVLEQDAAAKRAAIEALQGELGGLEGQRRALDRRLGTLARLEEYTEFREIDHASVQVEIGRLEDERRELETGSDVLQAIERQIRELEVRTAQTRATLKKRQIDLGSLQERRNRIAEERAQIAKLLAETPSEVRALFAALEAMHAEARAAERERGTAGEAGRGGQRGRESAGDQEKPMPDLGTLAVENAAARESEVRGWLQRQIDNAADRQQTLAARIVKAMTEYRREWPLETREVDASVKAGPEYARMLASLEADELPRFEQNFKKYLNENTIREVAAFSSQLAMQREIIGERIDRINESLIRIDYSQGRYIRLEKQENPDEEIRLFRRDLKECTSGYLGPAQEEQYSENRFLLVKKLLDRFRGRADQALEDERWTAKVTDVRNWFVFAASERFREDDSEHEHYADSGGKSGGQKEKLAYTVLAASLAYQFGLEVGGRNSDSFRFVVIDEAFGRGSDESAQYGLRLFSQLKLQFLIVTPLQKIHIIEPFVAHVGYVQNLDGQYSVLRNLSIEEYRQEKAARQEAGEGETPSDPGLAPAQDRAPQPVPQPIGAGDEESVLTRAVDNLVAGLAARGGTDGQAQEARMPAGLEGAHAASGSPDGQDPATRIPGGQGACEEPSPGQDATGRDQACQDAALGRTPHGPEATPAPAREALPAPAAEAVQAPVPDPVSAPEPPAAPRRRRGRPPKADRAAAARNESDGRAGADTAGRRGRKPHAQDFGLRLGDLLGQWKEK